MVGESIALRIESMIPSVRGARFRRCLACRLAPGPAGVLVRRIGALLLEQSQQDEQDGAKLRLDGRLNVAEDRPAIRLDLGMSGRDHGVLRLLALDDLEEEHDALVEARILGQQPLDFVVAQIGDIGRAGHPVLSVG